MDGFAISRSWFLLDNYYNNLLPFNWTAGSDSDTYGISERRLWLTLALTRPLKRKEFNELLSKMNFFFFT